MSCFVDFEVCNSPQGDSAVLEKCESEACRDLEKSERQMPLCTFDCNAV